MHERMAMIACASCALLSGCVGVSVTDEEPVNVSRYATIYFSSESSERVSVQGLIEKSINGNYSGLAMPGRTLTEPMYLTPGWVVVTYACPQQPQKVHVATVGISHAKKYYLQCDANDRLKAFPL